MQNGSGFGMPVSAASPTLGLREQSDPWAHRSEGMRCASCMWFCLKVKENPVGPALGRCRRHAPTMSGYPAVFSGDWCGDHKLDENKF